jgi:hypothetical protein
MSSSPERQAGTSGSTMGYEQEQGQGGAQERGQAQGQTPSQAQERDYRPAGRDYQAGGRHATEQRGAVVGFTALAGTLMLLGGLWMVTVAIVALSHGQVFSSAPTYTFRYNIRGWGWTELALGVVLFAAGMCVFLGMAWARYVGAFFAVLSAIANFVFIPYQPLWSIVMIALDAFIIWALLTPRRTPYEF